MTINLILELVIDGEIEVVEEVSPTNYRQRVIFLSNYARRQPFPWELYTYRKSKANIPQAKKIKHEKVFC
jgi:hypothetical protein